jgi:hypothetical protein
MNKPEHIRARALVEAMLALGVKELTLRQEHAQSLHGYEITSTQAWTARCTSRSPGRC